MKKSAFISICILLLIMAGVAIQMSYDRSQGEKVDNRFSIPNLQKAEEDYRKKINSPDDRSGRVNQRKVAAFERQDLNLTDPEIAKLFKKDLPLDKPSVALSYVFTWAALAIADTMTFGFSDYEVRLSKSSRYFSEDGWKSFSTALKQSKIIERMEERREVITAVPKGSVLLRSSGWVDGVHQDVLEMPLAVTYMSGARAMNQEMVVTVVVVRSNEEKHPMGIAINQWLAYVP